MDIELKNGNDIKSNKTLIYQDSIKTKNSEGKRTDNILEYSRIGTVVKNRYKIEKIIGSGGLCDIYQALDMVLEASGADNPFVALKILQDKNIEQPETIKMLMREAQITQKLSHPNIVRVFDFGVDNNIYFIVMELIDGDTLENIIKRSRPRGLSFKQSMALLNPILDAIHYSHSKGIIHSDLKPANIMSTRDGDIKLLDFGISNKTIQDEYSVNNNQNNESPMGYTPNYASENVISGKAPSVLDDIFSFSCILYELLTSKSVQVSINGQVSKNALTKPSGVGFNKWNKLKKILLNNSVDKIKKISDIQNLLNGNISYNLILPSFIFLVLSTYTAFYVYNYNNINNFEKKINILEHELLHYTSLIDTPLEDVLNVVKKENNIIIEKGLLFHHKKNILLNYENQIERLIISDNYPDYFNIEKLLSNALTYYPDSFTLKKLSSDINTSKISHQLSISNEINNILENGEYMSNNEYLNIVSLYDSLIKIDKDYIFTPSKLSHDIFSENLNTSIKNLDVNKIHSVFTIGEKIFSSFKDYETRLSNINKMKDSIEKINLYNNDKDIPFPYEAAKIVYASKVNEILDKINVNKSMSELEDIMLQINHLSKLVPNDYPDISNLRLNLANKYIYHSELFLENKNPTKAMLAMKKANSLMYLIKNQDI